MWPGTAVVHRCGIVGHRHTNQVFKRAGLGHAVRMASQVQALGTNGSAPFRIRLADSGNSLSAISPRRTSPSPLLSTQTSKDSRGYITSQPMSPGLGSDFRSSPSPNHDEYLGVFAPPFAVNDGAEFRGLARALPICNRDILLAWRRGGDAPCVADRPPPCWVLVPYRLGHRRRARVCPARLAFGRSVLRWGTGVRPAPPCDWALPGSGCATDRFRGGRRAWEDEEFKKSRNASSWTSSDP